MARVIQSRDAWALVFLAAWHCVYFFPITLAQGVWFNHDIRGVYYPYALEYVRALGDGRLPLWTTLLQSGFPLLAEGQVAAFYPTRALLLTLMPAHFALSYEVLLHLFWLACGMYFLVRRMGLGIASALLAGFVFSFNGFALQKIQHIPILVTMAWLPWLILFQDQFQRAQRDNKPAAKWFLLFSAAAGVQWLAGSPQTAVMNSMTVGLVGLFGGLFWNDHGNASSTRLNVIPRVVVWTALPILLGIGIGAIQIAPTMELVSFSVRAGDMMNDHFRTSYSLPPEFLAQFVLPFAPSDPSDDNVEYWGYIGLLTFTLAVSAPFLRREARTFFFAAFALGALSFTLGGLNPVYAGLVQLPGLNFFRVPARYLMLFTFAVTILAALAFEALARRVTDSSPRRAVGAVALFALLTGATIWLAYNRQIDFWLNAWQTLPFVLGVLTASILALAWTRRLDRATLSAAIIGLTVFDLAAYAAPFINTINATTSPAYVTQIPRSVPALGKSRELERVLTDESLWPSVPARRSSLFPNMNVPYGIEHAHAYSPLVFGAHEAYIFNLSPAMLNLMNVRYVMVPLEPRPENRATTPPSDLRLDVVDNLVMIPPTAAAAVEIASFTEETTARGDGFVAAELVVAFENGTRQTFPLRVGNGIADWDYGYTSKTFAPPRDARVAHSVAAFVRALGRTFDGYVYRARFDLASAHKIVAVEVKPQINPARLTVENISLIDSSGKAVSLAALAAKNDFVLKYISDTTAAWENLNVLPRAFLVHRTEILSGNDMFGKLHDSEFHPDQTVLLQEGQPLDNAPSDRNTVKIERYKPEQIIISAATERAAYLFLADTWYPGWNAFVNDRPMPIYRANAIFRAVPLGPGEHSIRFEYRPMSLLLGAIISAASLMITISIAFALARTK